MIANKLNIVKRTVKAVPLTYTEMDTNLNELINVIDDVSGLSTSKEDSITAGSASQYYRGDKTFQTLNKAAVGLNAVDNTADGDKPVSAAQQTAFDLKMSIADLANTSDGTKGVSLVAGSVRYVNNINSLTLLNGANILQPVYTRGYTTVNDGGAFGPYRWDGADTTSTADGVTIFGTGTGRWKLIPSGVIPNVVQAGAKGDGVTNDTAAFQACIAAFGVANVPYRAAGYVVGNLTLGTNQKIIAASKTKLFIHSAASFGVRVVPFGIGTYSFIENVLWDGVNVGTSIPAILAGTASGSVFGLRVNNTDGMNLGAFYAEEVHATNWSVDVTFQDCLCYFTRGVQFYSRRSRGFFNLIDFKVDHTYNTGQVSWGGIQFDDFIGVELTKVDVVGPVSPTSPTVTYQPTAIGIKFIGVAGSASVWLRRVLVDNTRGPGISINSCHNVFSEDTCVFQNLGPALELVSVLKSQFVNTKIVGGLGMTSAASASNGLSMTSCSSVDFHGLQVEANTGNGVVQVSCTDCKIIGGYSNGNTQTGYLESTSATRNLRMGVTALSNGTNSLVQIGAQSATTNWWANSGTFIASNVGAITV